MSIVSDLTAGGTDISLCSLGVMGTVYERTGVNNPPQAITVDIYGIQSILIDNIVAKPLYQIGNPLDIHLR